MVSGNPPNGSKDAPGFFDLEETTIPARPFAHKPNTVFMFDISPNSPAGTPRDVATMHQKGFDGRRVAKFHGDYANVLYMSGAVGNCSTDDLVTDRDFRRGKVIWNNPKLYWGYLPP